MPWSARSPGSGPRASARSTSGDLGENGRPGDRGDALGAPATTFDSMICVAIVTATSSGVRAPICTPIGRVQPREVGLADAVVAQRCSRSVRVFSLPIAPM